MTNAVHVESHEALWMARRRMVDDLLAELRVQAATKKDPRPVTLLETHVSWVLLGPDVYKIKKPVVLPFLDFSGFEAREEACRNEVKINRRLAPRTYLGVVPVRRRSDGRFTFGAAGSIVDWSVRMRRLDETMRADVLLARAELDVARVDALACAIAAFHADAEANGTIAGAGSPVVVEHHVNENFAALRALDLVPAATLEEIERWQHAFLRGQKGRFEARMRGGFVRDGHGDLRLEHVFFLKGGDDFEIIDGIEFDDRYRFGDVCADIAFFAMDLARLGRVDLAERFIATYARVANDFDVYGVLDFYESYRACIRAKIAGVAARTRFDRDEDAAREARRDLLLASAAQKRALLPPILVAVAGGIATGKSTLAERIALDLGAPIVDADRTRKHMTGRRPTEHRGEGAWTGVYDPAFSELVYAEVLRRAEVVLSSGRAVVVDASFRTAAARAQARELASRCNVPFRLVECLASLETCRERVRERAKTGTVSDATPELVDDFASRFEPITELPPTEHVRVDTSGAAGDPIAVAESLIATWPPGLRT